MNLVYIGHSFARRCKDTLVPEFRCSDGRRMASRDISMNHGARAGALAIALRIDHIFQAVYTETNGLYLVKQLDRSTLLLTTTSPQAAIIDIGSNDIANVSEVDPNKMLKLATDVHNFACEIQPRLVVVQAVLPRTENLSCTTETFVTNADRYNQILRNLCEATTDKAVVFNAMRGFWLKNESGDCVGTPQPNPVKNWSTDGIHADKPDGQWLYQQRLRLVLLDNAYRINGSAPRRRKPKNHRSVPY